MCGKVPVSDFKWSTKTDKFTNGFIKNYDKNSDKGYILEVDVEYPRSLHKLHSDLPFLPEKRKIRKIEKLVCCLEDKEKLCITHSSIETSIKSWIKIIKGAQSN